MFDFLPVRRGELSVPEAWEPMERGWFRAFDDLLPCRTDIRDLGDRLLLQTELPGFERSDIDVDVRGAVLTIRARHASEPQSDDADYLRRERRIRSCTRSFSLDNIDPDAVSAAYRNGVLEVTLPKRTPAPAAAPRRIEIS